MSDLRLSNAILRTRLTLLKHGDHDQSDHGNRGGGGGGGKGEAENLGRGQAAAVSRRELITSHIGQEVKDMFGVSATIDGVDSDGNARLRYKDGSVEEGYHPVNIYLAGRRLSDKLKAKSDEGYQSDRGYRAVKPAGGKKL